MIKWIFSGVMFLLLLGLTVFVGFYLAIFLVGPHSDVLPELFHIPVSLIILIGVILIPFFTARKTYFIFRNKEKINTSEKEQ